LGFFYLPKQFLETQKKEAIQNPFYDDSPQTQGESYEKIFLYQKVEQSFQQAIA